MNKQLPLSFQAPENATFENYISGKNQQLIFSLKNNQELLIFLWGQKDSGKSHLLQALTTQYQTSERNAIYISFEQASDFTPEILQGLEVMELVCLDDIQYIIGNKQWEEALFHFFNKIRDMEGRLILAADKNALNLNIHLPDLRSRLCWGLTYQVQSADDNEKIAVLKLRAHQRGVEISDEVARYLMKRVTREMSGLIALLEKLDYASLAEQRKLTIPFIKKYL
jgi:DnaA-homolog protein